MKVVILQSNYIPWKGYFDLINDADVFIFYDIVKYTKNDWRNRNRVYGMNGLAWLSIPIHKDAVKLNIQDVTLPENWQETHHHYLCDVYRKAPCIDELKKFADEVYKIQSWTHLSELNQFIIKTICDKLGITTKILDSKNLPCEGNRIERLITLVKSVGGDSYLSGPAAKGYLDPHIDLFTKEGIEVQYKNYGPYKSYPQLSKPFENAVSIVDLIANLGFKDMMPYIKQKM